MDLARELFEESLRTRRLLGDAYGEAGSLMNLGNMESNQGHVPRAIELYGRALELSRWIGDRRTETLCNLNMGTALLSGGRAPEALPYVSEAVTLSERLGLKDLYCAAAASRAHTLFRSGDPVAAGPEADRALRISEERGNRLAQIVALTAKALCTGDSSFADRSVALARETGQTVFLCESLMTLAELRLRHQETAAAGTALDEILVLAAGIGALNIQARAEDLQAGRLP